MPPVLLYEPFVDFAAPQNPYLHFTFENWIFIQKWILVKLLWINAYVAFAFKRKKEVV